MVVVLSNGRDEQEWMKIMFGAQILQISNTRCNKVFWSRCPVIQTDVTVTGTILYE